MRSEFDFIRHIKAKHGLSRVGDDCAIIPKDARTDLVITADMLAEDVDFRLEWTKPELLGHKALAVSLSDVAAMGGTPKWAMLSIGVSGKVWKGKLLDKFYEGWHQLAEAEGVELIGGDVSRTPDKIVIDSVVIGEVRKGAAIQRSGAKPGDSIFVTGSLGGAAAGLSLLESGCRYSNSRGKERKLIEKQLCPKPRTEAGKYLSSRKLASAMIDVSDGLSADLRHLCEASGVGAVIYLDKIPVDENFDSFTIPEQRRFALGGGEDFELLFTSDRKTITSAGSTAVSRIGEVTANFGIVELVTAESRQVIPRLGYRHF